MARTATAAPLAPATAKLLSEFEEWVTRYGPKLSQSSAVRYRKYAAEFCRTHSALRATPQHLQAWRVSVEMVNGRKLAPSTVNVKLSALRAFFAFLVARGYRTTDPMTTIELASVPERLPNPFSKDQIKAIFSVVYAGESSSALIQDRAILETLYGSGLRRDELATLTLDSLVDRGTLRVIGKGDKERKTIITEPEYKAIRAWVLFYLADKTAKDKRTEVYATLPDSMGEERRAEIADDAAFMDLKKRRPKAPIFYSQSGTPIRDHAEPGKYVYLRATRYVQQALGPEEDTHPHRFRHTFATDLLDGGVDVTTLMKLMGHSDIRTTMIYLLHRQSIIDKARLAHPRS